MNEIRPIRTRGRPQVAVEAEVVRELSEEDLADLELERPRVAPLKQLRDSHHSVARYVAQGFSYPDISAMTGYSTSRIAVLVSDPAFKELVSFYRENTREAMKRLDERLVDATGTALSILQERLEDDPEAFENSDLLTTIKTLADRAGYGPSKTQNVNVNVGMAERIKAARNRVKVINPDGSVEDVLD